MGVGSQRAMLQDPALADSYRVREAAPDVLLFANLGAVQAREAGPERVTALVRQIGADAVCIHLNTAQELVQDEGDRDFRGLVAAIAGLVEESPVPVIVKETGCGFGPGDARAAARDRRRPGRRRGRRRHVVGGRRGAARLGAAARARRDAARMGHPDGGVAALRRSRAGMPAIASGGIRDALDVVRALALGATRRRSRAAVPARLGERRRGGCARERRTPRRVGAGRDGAHRRAPRRGSAPRAARAGTRARSLGRARWGVAVTEEPPPPKLRLRPAHQAEASGEATMNLDATAKGHPRVPRSEPRRAAGSMTRPAAVAPPATRTARSTTSSTPLRVSSPRAATTAPASRRSPSARA